MQEINLYNAAYDGDVEYLTSVLKTGASVDLLIVRINTLLLVWDGTNNRVSKQHFICQTQGIIYFIHYQLVRVILWHS